MANPATLKIEQRLDKLEARVGALEGGYVRVPPIETQIGPDASSTNEAIPETNESKPDLPDKETKDVEQDNGADPGDAAVETQSQTNSGDKENLRQADS